jgi:glucose-6-phosphate isomerase
MCSLKELSGLDVAWTPQGTLSFGKAMHVGHTAARPLARLKSVALDPEACRPADRTLYWMYGGIAPSERFVQLQHSGLRYELTLMFPTPVGRERPKTLGHIHVPLRGQTLGSAEIIEVQHGAGYFLTFNVNPRTRHSTFCRAIFAKSGDKLVVPPNLYHGAIVAGDEPLLFADVIADDVQSVYAPVERAGGMPHMLLVSGGWISNPRYAGVSKLKLAQAEAVTELNLTRERSLFSLFIDTAGPLSWLHRPADFPKLAPAQWRAVESFIVRERIEPDQ